MVSSTKFFKVLLLVTLTLTLASCWGKSKKARTTKDITQDRLDIPCLYLTPDGKEIKVPFKDAREVVLDPETKQMIYPAYTCTNPDCPGKDKGKNGRPYLFIWEDPTVTVNAEGKIVPVESLAKARQARDNIEYQRLYEEICKKKGIPLERACPECFKKRNYASETEEERQKYRDWVVRYELPEAAEQRKKLDEEHQRRLKDLERRRNAPLKPE